MERAAWLHLDGWAGRTRQAVFVVMETAKRYRIRADVEVRLVRRCLPVGETALVPKYAITFA